MSGSFAFTMREVEQALGASISERADALLQSQPPIIASVSPDGSRLTAVAPGPGGRTYRLNIALSRVAGRIRIKGFCSCPIGENCEHVGATLFIRQVMTATASPVDTKQEAEAEPAAQLDFDDIDFEMDAALRPVPLKPVSLTPVPLIPVPLKPVDLTPAAASADRPRLSPAGRQWLERLGAAVNPKSPQTVDANARRLVYLIERGKTDAHAGLWTVTAKTIGLDRDGAPRFTDQRLVEPDHVERLVHQGVRYLTEEDTAILRDLAWMKRQTPLAEHVVLRPGLGAQILLKRMLATGRLHHAQADTSPLVESAPVEVDAIWQSSDPTWQQLVFVPRTGAPFDAVVALDPPHYLRDACIGTIIVSLPPAVAVEVARAPALTRVEAALLRDDLERMLGKAAAAPAASPSLLPPQMLPAQTLQTQTMQTTGPTPSRATLPLPAAATRIDTKRIAPTVHLRLYMSDVRLKERFRAHAPDGLRHAAIRLPLAALSFDYDGERVALGDPRPSLDVADADGALSFVPRDRDREEAAAQWLRALRMIPTQQAVFDVQGQPDGVFWLRPPPDVDAYAMLGKLTDADRYIAFSAKDVPRLEKAGWRITFDADYPYRIASGAVDWWADVEAGSRIDWFSFALGITYEGQRVNLIPQLASLLQRLPASLLELARKPGAEKSFAFDLAKLDLFAQLPDGRLIRMPADRMAPILRQLLDLIGPRPDRLRDGQVTLHRAEAPALTGIADAVPATWATNARAMLDLGRALKEGRGAAPVDPPASFLATLRPYQRDGLAWLAFLRETGFGGVLADDMGLGKTVQTLAFLTHEKHQGRLTRPALIVAPTSVLPNWQAEASKFAPDLRVLAWRGPDRKDLRKDIASNDLVLTTYPLLARDHEVLLAETFHVAILDEAQAIKNPKATVSGIAQRIQARHRLALTGTPLENNLGEVWSLFEFLSPGLLGDQSSFKRQFQTPIEKHGDRTAQAFLSRRLKPFLLRRTKAEVAKELPPKSEIIERIELEGGQRDLDETVRALMEKRVREEIDKKGLAKSHIIFLDALLKLRQICCDPHLLKMDEAQKVKQSAKRERLMTLLPEMVAEGRRILVFSQFTSMLDLIEADLKKAKIGYVKLRGDTDDRAKPVQAFQAGAVPVFLLSLKAGGTGLNLTAADTVIHYDPWWNPAVENQATDRAYRIGQDKPVFVYKLLVAGSIEDAIELLKQKKTALAEALYASDAGAPLKLTADDIAALFTPLGKRV